MRIRILGTVLIVVMLLIGAATIALADHGTATPQGNCPAAGKIDATPGTQAAINGTVLPAGTHVCVKGGQTIVFATADGVKTLKQILGTGQDVSHYTIIQAVTTTTAQVTTTTAQVTTTTAEVTTTTAPPTTTTQPEVTTTTGGSPGPGPTTTVPAPTTTIPFDVIVTTTVAPTTTAAPTLVAPTAAPELPFTGFDPAAFAGIAGLLTTSGAYLVRKGRKAA